MNDKVICQICGKSMTCINNRHLATHGITAEKYREQYPGYALLSETVAKKLSERSVSSNENRKGVPRSEAVKEKMREAHAARRDQGIRVVRGPMSQEQKAKLSKLALERYRSGFQHPNLGKPLSEEMRKRISKSLTGRIVGPDAARKAIATRRERGDDLAFFRGEKHNDETKSLIAKKSSLTRKSQRCVVRAPMLERMAEANLTLLSDVSDDVFHLQCNVCSYLFSRTPQMFQPSKFDPEVCDQCFPIAKVSKAEFEIAETILSIRDTKIVRSDAEQIAPLELDLYLPDEQLAIEHTGLYWHSELRGKHRWYHRHKFEACQKKGIRLLTIFEDEWLNSRPIAESILRNCLGSNSTAINARSCEVQQLEADAGNDFLKKNHIQGSGRSSVKLGLIYNGELISAMSFIKGEISRHNSGWEINRFCTKLGVTVRGGASRLFAAFVRTYRPEMVTSYADLRWGTGAVYGKLGFELVGNSVPNYWYFRPNEMRRYHRYTLRKQPHESADQTEWQIRQSEGWDRIWDCGHAKWVWHASVEDLTFSSD